jgi:hypothetical protein
MEHIGIEAADRTLSSTTQLVMRNAIHPVQRRFATEFAQFRYPRLAGRHGRFFSDTYFGPRSLRQNKMGQIFVNDIDFVKHIPMQTKSQAGDALVEFIQDVGIPSDLHTDNAKELTEGKWAMNVKKFQIKQTETEPFSPWQN